MTHKIFLLISLTPYNPVGIQQIDHKRTEPAFLVKIVLGVVSMVLVLLDMLELVDTSNQQLVDHKLY